jgi:hypothetical protein
MVSPYLGIPRIEDRRYDVVIDFHSATPFALSRYAYLRLKPWSFPTARVVFRSPTFNHDCIETDLIKNYLHLFLAMMGSILDSRRAVSSYRWVELLLTCAI